MDQIALWAEDPILGGVIGGAAIGLFVLLLYGITGKALGASTAYGNVCAVGSRLPFFKTGEYESVNNWRLWLWLGLPLGGLIGMLTSPNATWEGPFYMGAWYESLFTAFGGDAAFAVKAVMLVGGGILLGLGARMAGGCQSGHSINGMSMLNPPSLVASVAYFIGGIIAVQVLFRVANAGFGANFEFVF